MRPYAIIVAADLPDEQAVLRLAGQVAPHVDGIKVSAASLITAGRSLVTRLRDIVEAKPILVDLKIADIGFRGPHAWEGTNAKIIATLAGSGATHVTVHAFPGPASVAEAVDTAHKAGLGVLLLPLMSHPGAGLFYGAAITAEAVRQEMAQAGLTSPQERPPSMRDVTDAILFLGDDLGADGYIGPATRPDELKRYRSVTPKPVWSPGFGRQDRLGRDLERQLHDWAAALGPASAAIVGSTIIKAADPARAAQEVTELRDRVTTGAGPL